MQLSLLLNEVIRYSELLEFVVFKHIYRERNALADDLVKASTLMQEGFWHISMSCPHPSTRERT